jgi:hypothetical protein
LAIDLLLQVVVAVSEAEDESLGLVVGMEVGLSSTGFEAKFIGLAADIFEELLVFERCDEAELPQFGGPFVGEIV